MAKSAKPKFNWRDEPATEAQRKRLADDGIACPPNATKGEASDLISATMPAEDGDLQQLRFFGVTLQQEATQFDARRAVDAIFADPANVERWKRRPATKEQRDFVKAVEGKVPSGITANDAARRINDCHREGNEFAEKADAVREANDTASTREFMIRHYVDMLSDDASMYGVERVSFAVVTHAIEVMEAESGKSFEQLEEADTHFTERLAERIRAIDPSKASKEFHECPSYFRPWVPLSGPTHPGLVSTYVAVSDSRGRTRQPAASSSQAMSRAARSTAEGSAGLVIAGILLLALLAYWFWK